MLLTRGLPIVESKYNILYRNYNATELFPFEPTNSFNTTRIQELWV